ncbi:MAG: fumarylacetoacetate hydrolase family protein [Candidatus Dormibacteraeota bacterium]|nr:fumarylacetoacetate hydrolase family protein [Candidatus Dormibacteraeota bacterium]
MGDNVIAYLEGHVRAREEAAVPLASLSLLAPVPCPGKVICVGLNYRDHAVEAGQTVPSEPVLFGKFANSVVGTGEAIVLPPAARQVDFEAELAVVIGHRTRRVPVDKALSCVAGYTCANDVSARDLQFRTGQWLRGKAIDTFLPLGPWLVTPDEIGDVGHLKIVCLVNGKKMQEATTGDMMCGVAEIVSFISETITLEPGDVIATGTPPGVGFSRTPPVFLQDGDEVTVTIDRIGSLTNPVRRV